MDKKLIIFDLDGVLIDSKEIHFNALNIALSEIDKKYEITKEEQKKIYEALPTNSKLKLLTQYKGLNEKYYDQIWNKKQKITKLLISNIQSDIDLLNYFTKIKSNNINIAIASNSIEETIKICLKSLKIYDFVDYVIGSDKVINSKPHPEMYWRAMSYFGAVPEETVIFEDSIVGKIAASDSYANLIEVKNRKDLTEEKIDKAIKILKKSKSKLKGQNINILVPMAGAGSRFSEVGYSFPKPLIDVNGKPMIQAVVDNLAIEANYIYIVQNEHYVKYGLEYLLNAITPNCKILKIDGITQGAAVTALFAKEFIDNDTPLLIANSDQIIDWSGKEFIFDMMKKNADGGIIIFESTHPKWSYVKINQFGLVIEVAEKKPISNNATAGIYFWKMGSDFIKYAKQMIEKNIKTNNEFYICPVFNEAIEDGKRIYTSEVKKMWGIGTPEDLEKYLNENYIS